MGRIDQPDYDHHNGVLRSNLNAGVADIHTGLNHHTAVDAGNIPNPGFQVHALACFDWSVANAWCNSWRLGVDTSDLDEPK